jgi:hypothetical protein
MFPFTQQSSSEVDITLGHALSFTQQSSQLADIRSRSYIYPEELTTIGYKVTMFPLPSKQSSSEADITLGHALSFTQQSSQLADIRSRSYIYPE